MIEYTESPLIWEPNNSSWVSVTPNGTSYASSAWHEVIASTASGLALAAIAIGDWFVTGGGGVPYDVMFDVGVGGAGSEVVIGTIGGLADGAADNHVLYFPVPIDAISAGVRVSVRMRKEGSGTTTWPITLGFYEKPVTGTMVTTAAPSLITDNAGAATQATTGGSAWTNGAWVTIIASAAADSILAAVSMRNGSADNDFELDIGVGAAASEVVIATVRKNVQSSVYGFSHLAKFPLVTSGITAGARVAIRARGTLTTAGVQARLVYYQTSLSALKTTTSVLSVYPSAADGIGVTVPGSAWTFSPWTTLEASTATDVFITGLTCDKPVGDTHHEFEVGVGGSGVEVTVARWKFGTAHILRGAGIPWHLPVPVKILAGQRISVRARRNATVGQVITDISLQYYPALSADTSQTELTHTATHLGSDGALLTPSASAYVNSSWVELLASAGDEIFVTGIGYVAGSAEGELCRFDVDLGTGGVGSEVVFTTVRAMIFYTDNLYIFLPVAHRIAAGTRISARIRKQVTGTNNTWDMDLMYFGSEIPVTPLPGPPMQRASYVFFSNQITEKQVETRLTKTFLQILYTDPPATGTPGTLTLTEVTGVIKDEEGNTLSGRLYVKPSNIITVDNLYLISTETTEYDVTGAISLFLAPSETVTYLAEFDPTPEDVDTPRNLKLGYWRDTWTIPDVGSIDIAEL